MPEQKTVAVCAGIIGVPLVIAVVAILGASLKKLESYEIGVKYDRTGKILAGGIDYSGLHAGPPGFEFVTFPSVFKTIHFPNLECLTYDGAEIELDVQYQYKALDDEVTRIIRLFRNHDQYVEVLKLSGRSVLQKSCSSISADDIVKKRVKFANITNEMLITKNRELMTVINGLQINNIQRPSSYNNAQKNKESVRENIQVKIREREDKIIEAGIVVEQAMADAKITLQRAILNARNTITRAEKEAEAITKEAEVEATVYRHIVESGFTESELVKYITVNTLASSSQDVQVSVNAPANLP